MNVHARTQSLRSHQTTKDRGEVVSISGAALVAQLKQIAKRRDLQGGKLLHSNAIETGCQKNPYVASALITMYSKCGSMQDALDVFKNMLQRDVVSWTALILGYVENGECLVAWEMFNTMDCAPNNVTYMAVLKACASLAAITKSEKNSCLQKGVALHRQARERGFDRDVFVANTLVDMYSKCGDMLQAKNVFDGIMHRNAVSWNVLMLGYVENGESSVALDLFSSMNCPPNRVTFVAALKACSGSAMNNKLDKKSCLENGLAVHRQAREQGFDREDFVASTLVDMYMKCGEVSKARDVFDRVLRRDVVCWTSLILGYVENGESLMALDAFNSMECAPDSFTFVAALKACVSLATDSKLDSLQKGMIIHRQARKRGFDKHAFVSCTLIDMYSKCGDMLQARNAFDGMKHRDVVSWTALILGYVENGESLVALDVFNSMDCAPNGVTFSAALKACASLGALEIGERIHNRLRELGLEEDEMVVSCLVDFYGKCGNMAAAQEAFNSVRSHDVVSWNALIGSYSLLGDTPQVFTLVKRMQEGGVKMDSVTMLLILTACSHAGMVEEGQSCFESMSKFGIIPTVEHYICMVDILGRANRLQEALSLVRNVPFEAQSPVWMTLLGACKKWSNVEIGKVAFSELLCENNKEHVAAACVLMRSIYERLGMREERDQIQSETRGRKKAWWCNAGERMVQSFVAGYKMESQVTDKLKALLSADT